MEDDLNKLHVYAAIAIEKEIMKWVFKDTGIKENPHGRGIITISQLEKAIDHERSFDGMFTAEEQSAWKQHGRIYNVSSLL